MADAGIGRTEEGFWPQSLRAEALMTYMRVLCKEIGPRHPTSNDAMCCLLRMGFTP